MWNLALSEVNAIIFVVDSSNEDRLEEAREMLFKFNNEIPMVPILVFANKQDLQNAISVEKLEKSLELEKLKDREWLIQACSAVSGDGLYEGMSWLAQQCNQL